MTDNRFAPPKADVEGAPAAAGQAPALWNPNATANWCLLFSPAFGAWLQMKNWTALGETERAATAKSWLIACAVILGVTILGKLLMPRSPLAALGNSIGFLLLIVWYFANGRAQASWVKERFGADYPRRGWTQPLLWGLAFYVGVFAIAFVAAAFTRAAS